jgi:hypothetical protein
MKTISAMLTALAVLLPAVASAAERLVVKPYPADPAWVLANDGMSQVGPIQEYIPVGQTLGDHKDILSVQTFPGMQQVPPADFLRGLLGGVNQACSAVLVNGPVERKEDGFKVAYGQAYCGQQNGKSYGLHIFFKIIPGREALYVINREFRTPATTTPGALAFPPERKEEALALFKAEGEANTYLTSGIYLCGDGTTEARCRP